MQNIFAFRTRSLFFCFFNVRWKYFVLPWKFKKPKNRFANKIFYAWCKLGLTRVGARLDACEGVYYQRPTSAGRGLSVLQRLTLAEEMIENQCQDEKLQFVYFIKRKIVNFWSFPYIWL